MKMLNAIVRCGMTTPKENGFCSVLCFEWNVSFVCCLSYNWIQICWIQSTYRVQIQFTLTFTHISYYYYYFITCVFSSCLLLHWSRRRWETDTHMHANRHMNAKQTSHANNMTSVLPRAGHRKRCKAHMQRINIWPENDSFHTQRRWHFNCKTQIDCCCCYCGSQTNRHPNAYICLFK